jgi:2-phospho-L-lactate guanylyltransferase
LDNIYAIIPVSKFTDAKTRLSPFLSATEREELLKAMLKDVTKTLKKLVDKIIIISRDSEVLDYAKELKLDTLVENDDSNLNKALNQAMDYCRGKTRKVLIMPSDVPLIGKTNIKLIIKQANKLDFLIMPSKGGGTNALIIKPCGIDMEFGDFSFQKHVENAEAKGLSPIVHDSFYMALDVNTTEDLGEIMIHGKNTHTKKYLESLGISVESIHGHERLKVTRD